MAIKNNNIRVDEWLIHYAKENNIILEISGIDKNAILQVKKK